jgi:chromosome segregation ATPase
MSKPVNIAGTAQAQLMEIQQHFGGSAAAVKPAYPDLRDEYAAQSETIDQLNSRVSELTVLNGALQTDIDTATARVAEVEAELEATRDKLQAAGTNVDELNAEIEKLKAATTKRK